MRDLDRISDVLEAHERVWRLNPDLRLAQLIVAAARPDTPCPEIFFAEDDKLLSGRLEYERQLNNP